MRKIKAQDTEFFISVNTADAFTEFPLIVDNPWQLEFNEFYQGDDVKLIMFEHFRPNGRGILYWLYFKGAEVGKSLNYKLLNDSFTDDDFIESVKTQYQITWCPNCRREYHTLIIPPGDPYPGNFTLMEEKLTRFIPFLRCPYCNSSFRQGVVKVIGEVK